MRDLSQHPITAEEIVECLTTMASELSAENAKGDNVGDVRPLLLLEAAAIVERAEAKRTADSAIRGLEQAYEYLKKNKPPTQR